jgi:hypothetical protein
MKIGALVFLTEQSGNPGAIAREAENLGFESFFVAEHMVVPTTYTTHYPRSRDGKVPEFYARLIDPFVALAIRGRCNLADQNRYRYMPPYAARRDRDGQGDRVH